MAIEKIMIPDFGVVQKITVIDVFIAQGDRVEKETSLVSLESEKAVMDLPSPLAGIVNEVLVKEESVVKSGDVIALIETDSDGAASDKSTKVVEKKAENEPVKAQVLQHTFHATPSVRALARKMQVDLTGIIGTGPNNRIQKEDILHVPQKKETREDFSIYGAIEEIALGRIKKISGPYLQKSWNTIPHVTHFEETDISELDHFRKELNESLQKDEPTYSQLVFIIRAVVATLKEFPLFNSSLLPEGDKVVLKKYYNIGIAVDTPNGLVVPVIKNVNCKGVKDIAAELQKLSSSAREGKLSIPDSQGASFTISSLGGIGGTGFTPIISSPQVAILGLSRNYVKPVWNEKRETFEPRLTMPFSLSYDHRVIDGAEAARFCNTLRTNIEDLKRTIM